MKQLIFNGSLIFLLIIAVASQLYAEENIVFDPEKNLEWQRADQGEMMWESAKKYCKELTLNGKNDWRLPNITELKSKLRIKDKFPESLSRTYWTSTPNPYKEGRMWVILLFDGLAYGYNKTGTVNVRCVRTK